MADAHELYAAFAIPLIGKAGASSSDVPWSEILNLGVRMNYTRNSMVRAEGATRFDLFYLEKGQVQVLFDTLDGRMRSVVSFEAGSMFNLAQAAARREASGQYNCVTDAIIWRLPGELLHNTAFAARYPELMLWIIQILGRVVLTHHTFLTDMLMDDFIIRFSRFLVSMSFDGGEVFTPGMTQERLAAMFGVHRATLARAIQQLKHEGIIDGFTKKRVHILDMVRLRELAGGNVKKER